MLTGKIKYLSDIFRNYTNWYDIIFCRVLNKPIKKVILRDGTFILGDDKSLAIDIVDEIFVRNVYNPSYLQIKPNDVVVDIGANIGVFSIYAALKGATSIFSVEPLKGNLRFIKENFRINDLDLPVLINSAVSDKNGLSRLYLSDYNSHGLLFNRNNIQKFNRYNNVNTLKFSSLLKKYKINRIDFLKIDCEGSEGYIFSNSNISDWKNIKKISIEYHNGVSILSDKELIQRLSALGYKTKVEKSDDYFGYIYAWK